jgi:diguanylate cyclase (GGDEF)-like protein
MTLLASIPVWGQIALSALIGGTGGLVGAFMIGRGLRGRAHRVAFFDHLTGIGNRRAFVRRLESEWRCSAQAGGDLGILVIDVDAFGDINQHYGRHAGDRVLAEVAERIRLRVRETDFVARLEADEFAVICPDTPLQGLVDLRRTLEAYVNFARTAPVALGIGVAAREVDDQSFEQMLRRARESMLARRDQRPIRAVDEALQELLTR